MASLYLVCTLLSAIWALGDFNAVRFISGGGPALSTHVLATLGIRNAFELGNPALGMATVLSALPLLIPLVIAVDAPAEERPGGAVSLAAPSPAEPLGRGDRPSAVLSALLIVWTLVPLYNMVRVALQEKEDVFSSNVIPDDADAAQLLDGLQEVLLAAGQLLGPDGQQLLHRHRRRLADADHRHPCRVSPSGACVSSRAGCCPTPR